MPKKRDFLLPLHRIQCAPRTSFSMCVRNGGFLGFGTLSTCQISTIVNWHLNPARLPVPPRARGHPKGGRPITGVAGWATRSGTQPTVLRCVRKFGEPLMQQLPDEPPTTPVPATPEPSKPGQPTEPPPGIPTHEPDIDVPSPPMPGRNPSPGPISPVG